MPETPAALIGRFARDQLDLAAADDFVPSLRFAVAGAVVGLQTGNGSALTDWVRATAAQVLSPVGPFAHRLVCRLGGAHLAIHPDFSHFTYLSTQQFEAALAAVGLQGRLTREPLVWDIYDPVLKLGLRLQISDKAVPVWEATAPIANFMSWIADVEGQMMVHAATLGVAGRGCLILGEGGRGKSGTTLGGILHGLQTVGDDYVLLSHARPVIALPIYRSMKQDDGGLARCGIDPDGLGPLNWNNKRVFTIEQVAPGAMTTALPINAILLPEISNAPQTRFTVANQAAAFAAVMPSTLRQLSGARAARFAETAALVRDLPCYHLHLGTDPAEVTAALRGFLEAEVA